MLPGKLIRAPLQPAVKAEVLRVRVSRAIIALKSHSLSMTSTAIFQATSQIYVETHAKGTSQRHKRPIFQWLCAFGAP